jgi:hypothetical protein
VEDADPGSAAGGENSGVGVENETLTASVGSWVAGKGGMKGVAEAGAQPVEKRKIKNTQYEIRIAYFVLRIGE